MPHRGSSRIVPEGTLGFDCNRVLTPADAMSFFKLGYRFVGRYLPRLTVAKHDLAFAEVVTIFDAGLAITPVQHVELGEWTPTLRKGLDYGHVAAERCMALAIMAGTVVWLDLESVDKSVSAPQIIRYCNAWANVLSAYDFVPGLYVGDQCGLTPQQLYNDLKFHHYWRAYNLNDDEVPAVRGVQMRQQSAHWNQVPAGFEPSEIDRNVVEKDLLGELPTMFVPEEWSVG